MLNKLRKPIAIVLATLASVSVTGGAQTPPTPAEVATAQEWVARRQQGRLVVLKDALESPDAEFKILRPKLLRVMTLQYEQGIGYSGVFRRQRGLNGPVATVLPPSEVQQARMDLQDALDKQDVTTGEIVEKLRVLRAVRARARAELVAAQSDLRDFVTLRQEAVLVGMGLLD